MKKIRLVDQTEIEIYNITQSGDTLQIDILNGDATALEETFKDADNLSVIQYYVEEDLMIAYARFDQLQSYVKRMSQVLAVDYTIEDETTDSGFAETNSKNFQKVKNYYNRGLWDIDRVYSAVGKWITEAEYKEITGFTYPDKE